MKNTKA